MVSSLLSGDAARSTSQLLESVFCGFSKPGLASNLRCGGGMPLQQPASPTRCTERPPKPVLRLSGNKPEPRLGPA